MKTVQFSLIKFHDFINRNISKTTFFELVRKIARKPLNRLTRNISCGYWIHDYLVFLRRFFFSILIFCFFSVKIQKNFFSKIDIFWNRFYQDKIVASILILSCLILLVQTISDESPLTFGRFFFLRRSVNDFSTSRIGNIFEWTKKLKNNLKNV